MAALDPVRERFRRQLAREHVLGLHLGLLFALTVGLGLLGSRLWLALGFEHLILRSMVNCGLTYVLFLGLLRLWVAWLHWRRPELAVLSPADAALAPGDPPDAARTSRAGADDAIEGGLNLGEGAVDLVSAAAEGELLGAILAGLAFLVAGAAMSLVVFPWLWVELPALLMESAFQVALSASLVRRAGKLVQAEGPGWLPVALSRTFVPFLIVAAVVLAVTSIAHVSCDAPSRLAGCFR